MTSVAQKALGIGCLILFLPVVVVVLLAGLLWSIWDGFAVRSHLRSFARKHGPDKRGIVVYSNSPNWQQYIEQRWIPLLAEKVVVLNWSDRSRWGDDVEVALFRRLGDREFNPAAIVFKQLHGVSTLSLWLHAIRTLDFAGIVAPYRSRLEIIRFFKAFRDYKHGKSQALVAAERKLFAALGVTPGSE